MNERPGSMASWRAAASRAPSVAIARFLLVVGKRAGGFDAAQRAEVALPAGVGPELRVDLGIARRMVARERVEPGPQAPGHRPPAKTLLLVVRSGELPRWHCRQVLDPSFGSTWALPAAWPRASASSQAHQLSVIGRQPEPCSLSAVRANFSAATTPSILTASSPTPVKRAPAKPASANAIAAGRCGWRTAYSGSCGASMRAPRQDVPRTRPVL